MKISAAALLLSAISALGQTAAVTTVHSFTGLDGNAPTSIVQASDGNLWGTTAQGGADFGGDDIGSGTIFKIYPDGTLITVYDFANRNNAIYAASPVSLTEGNDGNFYGTNQYVIYALSPAGTPLGYGPTPPAVPRAPLTHTV